VCIPGMRIYWLVFLIVVGGGFLRHITGKDDELGGDDDDDDAEYEYEYEEDEDSQRM